MEPDSPEPRTRVMVVDDHPMWRDAVERFLRKRGGFVIAACGDEKE